MSIIPSRQRRIGKLSVMAATLAIALMTGAGNVCALTPVQETGNALIQHIMNQINTYKAKAESAKEYSEQAMRWRNTIAHYQQQLATVRSFKNEAMAMGITEKIEERPSIYGMEESCPDAASTFSLSSLFSSFSLDMKGNIVVQQQDICQRIVLAQNAKYNEMVRMLKNIKKRSAELDRVSNSRDSVGTSQGKLESNSNDLDAILARLAVDMQYAETSIVGYEGYIFSLKEDQQRLATRAMRGGDKSWRGTVVQGAILKGALESLRERDR